MIFFQILLRRVDNKLELFMERTNRQLQNLQQLTNAAIESKIVISKLENEFENCRSILKLANQKPTANVLKSATAGNLEDEYNAANDAKSQTEEQILLVRDLCGKLESQHNQICIAKLEELLTFKKLKERQIEVLLTQRKLEYK